MRFTPHQRVLELFVGQNLYTSADAAIRELLQNAEDACSLQTVKQGENFSPAISIRFSCKENWVEVADNGIGMDQETLEKSFLQVGAPKSDVPKLRELMDRGADSARQIAQFGIGILSCFGVAQSIEVRTRADDSEGIAFEIPGLREDFQELQAAPMERGTIIRLWLNPTGPMNATAVPGAANKYSRHAPHIVLEDVDEGTKSPLAQRRDLIVVDERSRIDTPAVISGYLKLDSAWSTLNERFQSRLAICNAGFLVTEREVALLRPEAIGYVGEIDVRPGGLTILMNREGFKRDEVWNALAEELWQHYLSCLDHQLSAWETELSTGWEQNVRSAVERALLLLTRGPTRGALNPALLNRSLELLQHVLRLRTASTNEEISLSEVLSKAKPETVLYYIEEGQGDRQFNYAVAESGSNMQVTETAQTRPLRTMMLQATFNYPQFLRRSRRPTRYR